VLAATLRCAAMPIAASPSVAYLCLVVKQPFIYVEERIDRFVGRRTKTPDALSVETSRKADAVAWRKSLGGVHVPRGVHRFRTHEEADEWLWRRIARPRPS
jgi:hypothetical protein